MKTKTLAIVGGGTSGLVTALILKKYFPKLQVDLIESAAIGIVGVGEGSTEHWAKFMRHCGIDLKELFEETDATFKYGINFDNWNGDGKNYIQSVNGELNQNGPAGSKFIYASFVAKGLDPLKMVQPWVSTSTVIDHHYGINQFHFNTFKLNEYLHKKCANAGVNLIEAEIGNTVLDDNGYITSLEAKDGRIFSYDFYVDSTGFARAIVHLSLIHI